MNHLYEYIPTQPPAEDIKPLDLDATRKHYFGNKAEKYDLGRDNSEKWIKEHAAVLDALKGASGKVLDIPCGTGRFMEIYKQYGLDFIGMDVSEEMMVQARAKDSKAKIVHGDIMNIPLEDKSVNSVVCTRLLNLMLEDEMVEAIAELGRVTKDRIICGLFTGELPERHSRHWVHRGRVFEKAVNDAGFRLDHCYPIRKPVLNVWRCVPR